MPETNHMTDSKSDDNGAGEPSVIEYITQSGVQIYITPLSLFTIQAIINRSEMIVPYPAEQDYREASESFATGFIPASENPVYQELCATVDTERLTWQNEAIIALACKYPQYETDIEMLAHFRPRLEELRPYVAMHTDEWLNVLEHCVFTGVLDVVDENGKRFRTPERHRVIQLARQNANIALTMSEVIGGLRVFRLSIPGANVGGVAGNGSRRAEKSN